MRHDREAFSGNDYGYFDVFSSHGALSLNVTVSGDNF